MLNLKEGPKNPNDALEYAGIDETLIPEGTKEHNISSEVLRLRSEKLITRRQEELYLMATDLNISSLENFSYDLASTVGLVGTLIKNGYHKTMDYLKK